MEKERASDTFSMEARPLDRFLFQHSTKQVCHLYKDP